MPSKHVYDTVVALLGTWTPSADTNTDAVALTGGTVLTGDTEWTYTSVSAVTTDLEYVSSYPLNADTDIPTEAKIVVMFDRALDPASVTTANFVLEDSVPAAVARSVSYDASSQIVTITPSAALGTSEAHTLTMVSGASGVKGASAEELTGDVVVTFTTSAVTDDGLEVRAALPHTAATTAPPDLHQVVVFGSTAVDASTVTTSTFTAQPASARLPVAATVGVDTTANAAYLLSSSPYPGQTVTATLEGGVRPSFLATENAFNPLPDPPYPFVTVDFDKEDEVLASIAPPSSTRRWRETGEASLLVFVPSGTGNAMCLQWADEIRSVFRGVQSSNVTFRGAGPARSVFLNDSRGNWYGHQVTVDFVYDLCE